jgi:dephospho-CoA kinase
MVIKLGITGGIGSGKSVVSHLLQVMGIPVYIADDESKRLTESDIFIIDQLRSLYGKDIYQNGKLNKSLLASFIFNDPLQAAKVNEIIHPQVRADLRNWFVAHNSNDIVAMESAILVEAGFISEIDYLVMVDAPLEVRLNRVIKRDSSSKELVMSRIKSQMDNEKKKEYAKFIINNDDECLLIPQITALIKQLQL